MSDTEKSKNEVKTCPEPDALPPVTWCDPVQSTGEHVSRGVGLGIASLSLGVIACLTCWVPVVGAVSVGVALMGIGFGFLGVLVWILGGSPDSGLCRSGIFVSVVAVAVFILTSAATKSKFDELLAETDRRIQKQNAPAPLSASVSIADGRLVVINGNSFAWFDVTMTINGDYRWQTSMVPGREVIDMSTGWFRNDKGRGFMMSEHDDLDIYIETSYGSFYIR